MSAFHHILIFIIVLVTISGTGCLQPVAESQPAPAVSSVRITVPVEPVPVPSTEGINLAYELELTPVGDPDFVLENVEVIDPASGNVLYSPDAELLEYIYLPAANPLPTAEERQNGTGKLSMARITLWFKVRPDAVPDRLVHRLTLNRSASRQSMVTVTGADIAVRKDLKPVVVGSPVRGPGWVALETTAPTTHHFHAQITMNGVTRVPQRYAQDWIYVDPVTRQATRGNASLAKNYLGYGKEIYSVSNGTVVDMADGLLDVGEIFAAPPGTMATAAGNYVIVDIGNSKYACYAHMVPGSVRVKKGDTVTMGQILGRVGNSGNSDLPHLHFQVVTGTPSFLGAEGYPHVYRSFDLIGVVNQSRAEEMESRPGYDAARLWSEFGDTINFFPNPVARKEMLMENRFVVRFP